jgi:hypothetical protein
MPSSFDGTMLAKLLAVSCVLALAHDFPSLRRPLPGPSMLFLLTECST